MGQEEKFGLAEQLIGVSVGLVQDECCVGEEEQLGAGEGFVDVRGVGTAPVESFRGDGQSL